MNFLNRDNTMPIIGFYGPHMPEYSSSNGWEIPNYLDESYFQMLQECGINLINYFNNDYAANPKAVQKTLELGEKYDICMYVYDSGLKSGMTMEEIEERISEYSHYRSFKGIVVCDEPGSPDYGQTARLLENYYDICQKINSIEGVTAYINLFAFHPDWIGVDNNTIWRERPYFEAYVDAYCKGCAAKVVSEDYYIFDVHSVENSKDYFENLEILNEYAQKYDIPYWMHIQLGGQWNDSLNERESEDYYPLPTEVMWNVNTSLSCGAKGIAYFPLLQPYYFAYAPNGKMDFKRNGLITANGEKSVWYDAVKRVNQQIQAVDEYLMQMTLKQMVVKGHYAKLNLPKATTSYGALQSVVLGDEFNPYGVIIGCFDYHGSQAFYVVNNDIHTTQNITLQLDDIYTVRIISVDGNEKKNGDSCEVSLDKASAALILLEKE